MNNAWTIEFSRILVVVAASVLFGLVSGEWILAVLVPFAVYVGWMLVQIRALERWIRMGAKSNSALDSSGIWQLIVQHIVRAQHKNRERKQRLSQMASRFQATIAALPEATVVINSQREIELTNRASYELLGIDKQRDLGQKIDNLIRDPLFLNLIELSQSTSSIEIESPNDSLITLSVSCVEFGDSQKLITARDISQRLAVHKLRKAFIANASHELRTPLTVINGYLEMLEDADLNPGISRAINQMSTQNDRMKSLVNDLLHLSKLESDNVGIGNDWFELQSLCAISVDQLRAYRPTSLTGEKFPEAILSCDCVSGIEILGFSEEFSSVLINLITNAIKYGHKEGLAAEVKVTIDTLDEGLEIAVTDQGEGIASNHLSRLTERFYRIDESRESTVGGSGLGLAIVRHALDHHDAQLKIESVLGEGSRFSFVIPNERIRMKGSV